MISSYDHGMLRVARNDSEFGRWEKYERVPDQRLRAHVHGPYQGWFESTTRPEQRRELPSVIVPLIVNFGSPFRLTDSAGRAAEFDSFVAGLDDSYAFDEVTGDSLCIQVNFKPLGAHRFLGLPMDALAHRVVALEELLGAPARRLAEQLHDAPSWEARFELLDSLIAERFETGPEPSPGVAWTLRRLEETGGSVAIAALAAELGWSRRHLVAKFREQIGLPPKTVARILRFENVIRRLGEADGVRLAEIAYDCGYYDQAHLNRDFRDFAGTTPGEFLGHIRPRQEPEPLVTSSGTTR